MDLSSLKPGVGARQKRKRVGRGFGSGLGKTAGRGHKGFKSRSGSSCRPGFEGGQMPLNRRLPKRGFYHAKRIAFSVVNVSSLERYFDAGAEVTLEALAKAGLADPRDGGVKILGQGEVTKKLTLKVSAISAGARAKIEAAGGTVELLTVAKGEGASAQAGSKE